MRDAHRMKEKFDVTLDNRQIVSLLIASIVVLGAVFVLGVVVGKKLASNAQTAAAPDLLSALDANAQVLQQVREEEPLTFQDELTRKPSNEPPAAEPKKVTVALAPPKPAEPPAAPPEQAPKPEAPKPAAEPERTAARAESAPPQDKEPAAGKVEPAPVPTRTTSADAGSLKEAFARATRQPTEAAAGGAFTLQISAFQTRPEAERFAARLRDRGYAPYIVAAEVPGKGTWYRVRMGSFPSKEAAARYLADFQRETRIDAFVASAQ